VGLDEQEWVKVGLDESGVGEGRDALNQDWVKVGLDESGLDEGGVG